MKNTKVLAPVLALLCLCAALCAGCGEKDPYPSTATAEEIFTRVMEKAAQCSERDGTEYFGNGLIYVSDGSGKELGDGEKSYYYGTVSEDPDFSCVEQYALWTATDPVSTEFGVFKVARMEDTQTVFDFLKVRTSTLEQNAKDYNAAEYEKAQNALIAYHGRYVYYLVTSINHELEDVIRDVIAEYAAGN